MAPGRVDLRGGGTLSTAATGSARTRTRRAEPSGSRHNGDVTSLMPTRTITIGTRVMWAIVLVASIALVTCGAIVWALGHSSVSADATNRLEHSRDRIRQLAADRVDPSSGRPLEDVSSVLRVHIQRTAEGPGEAELGFVGTNSNTVLTWVSSDNVSFRPEEDTDLLKRVTSRAAASESVIETVRTPSSNYRVLVVPVQGGSQRGALVHVIDLKVAESQLQRTMAFYAAAAVFTVALVTGLAWFAVERLLRPIEQLRRATESIGEDDLTTRVPVKGRDDLTALAATVNRMLDRVQTSVEAQRNLLDDVGHELRTPIAVVRGHLELTDPADPEEVHQTQLLAIDELDRMGVLIDDLILLAKSAQSDFVTPVDTDVAELTELVFDKSLALGERRWQLESVAFTRAMIDPTRITQAWLQLVANAVKYSKNCSTVRLGSAVRDKHLRMWVGDEGIGIPPEEVDVVRQRFKRTASAQELASGTGLGLSIVETIVAAHGGRLDIHSQVGEGSVFTMRIPLAPVPGAKISSESGAPDPHTLKE